MTDNRKIIVIAGITGNQGGSVARTFLSDPVLRKEYRIRGISRDPSSPASKALLNSGVEEVVYADFQTPSSSLDAVFANAAVIFSVTDFWAPFTKAIDEAFAAFGSSPSDLLKQAKARNLRSDHVFPHPTPGERAYNLEYEQGQHIADAAARVPSLERFIVSTLNSPRKWSNNDARFSRLWHYESKADMVAYVRSQHPSLAAKLSTLIMGVYYTSWRFSPLLMPARSPEGGYRLALPCNPHRAVPLVDARRDTGVFVRALLRAEPNVTLLGASAEVSWSEYMGVWGRVLGVEKAAFEQVSVQSFDDALPGGYGLELADMFAFMGEVGFDGEDPGVRRREELGIAAEVTPLERFIAEEDWGVVGVERAGRSAL
ncbi:uncharacterized protein K452DRAFT_353875 [Aplosporella prunicola CBS 121167]|uniref:NmrA-like domain-containing protein n=1 Tax=Aplosporella prunicola CBS 121167 TaxID=1176127 RepID=A0A6A6AZD8_9PEZI|nr:uncharacterized protein K452DRAFT_353875 [Aplosporella prunicola CBS 121167]KAF2136553.1 hypothetical protein K452DRAFT_353875 [Aplosporella prunicola CBS 121167]